MSIESYVVISPTPSISPTPITWIDPSTVKCELCQRVSRQLPIAMTASPYTTQVHSKCRESMRPLENHIENSLSAIIEKNFRIENDVAVVIQKLQKLIAKHTLFSFMHNAQTHYQEERINAAVQVYYQEYCGQMPISKEWPSTISKSILTVELLSHKYPPVHTVAPPKPSRSTALLPLTLKRTPHTPVVRLPRTPVVRPQPTPAELPPPLTLGRDGVHIIEYP